MFDDADDALFCRQADLLSLALLSYSVQQAFSDRVDLLPIAELQYYCQVCFLPICFLI